MARPLADPSPAIEASQNQPYPAEKGPTPKKEKIGTPYSTILPTRMKLTKVIINPTNNLDGDLLHVWNRLYVTINPTSNLDGDFLHVWNRLYVTINPTSSLDGD